MVILGNGSPSHMIPDHTVNAISLWSGMGQSSVKYGFKYSSLKSMKDNFCQ